MKALWRRGIAVQAVLLAAALVWAYWVGHPDKNRPSGADQSFVLWQVAPEDVKAIRIHFEKSQVTLTPEPDAAEGAEGPYIWVTAELAEPMPPHPKPGETKKEAPEENERTLQFKGNRSAQQTFAALSTLTAQRRIGALDDLKAEPFGLPSEKEYIEVERNQGDPLRLDLGGSTYGNVYRYAHYTKDGAVYLIRESTVQSLARTPVRMMDRELFPFPVPQAEQVELRMGEKAVSFWRLPGAEGADAEWGDAPDAQSGDAAADGLIGDLAKLKAAGYPAAEATLPAGGAPALEVTLTAEGQAASSLHIIHEEKGAWIAQSTYTRHPVRLNGKAVGKILEAARAILQAH